MSKRKLLIIFMVSFIFLFIVCLRSLKSEESISKREITFWCMPNGPMKPHQKWLTKQALEFEQKYGIKVNYKILGWGQAFSKIYNAIYNQTGADVFQVGTTWNGLFAATGGLADVDDIVNEMGGEKFFVKPLLATCKYKNKYYGLPWFAETRCLVYNKKIFNKLGLKPPQTNKQLIAVGKKIVAAKGKGSAIVVVGTKAWDLLHNYAVMLWSNGGKILSDDNKSSLIHSDVAVKTMQWYIDLMRKGLADKECAQIHTPRAVAIFGSEKVAMAFMNTGDLDFIEKEFPDLKYGVVPPPKGNVKRASFAGGSNLVVLKGSKNISAAKAWVKFLLSKKAQLSYCKEVTKMLPGRLAAYKDPYFTNNPVRKIYKKVLLNATSYPPLAVWGDIENAITNEFSNLLDLYYNNKLKAGDIKKYIEKSEIRIKKALENEKKL